MAEAALDTGTFPPARRLHNQLLYITIAIDYLYSNEHNLLPEQQFIANCRKHIYDPASMSKKDVTMLMEALESKGKIGIGDYDVLRDIVKFDVNIIKEINDTELALHTRGEPIYERYNWFNEKRPKTIFVHRCKYGFYILNWFKCNNLKD